MEHVDKTPEQAAYEIIDQWIEDLIERIKSGDSSAPQRGLWDRFKGGLYNLFLGRQGKTAEKYNPYYFRNKFGDDLGVEESINLTLSDYANIKSAVFLTESKVADGIVVSEATYDKLKIVIMLRTAAKELKEKLGPLLSKYSGASAPAASAPAASAPAASAPAASVAAEAEPEPKAPATTTTVAQEIEPKPAGTDELSEESSMSEILEKMIQGKNTKEKILEAVQKGLIEGLLEKIDKGSIRRAKRFWGDYKTDASTNVEELKYSIVNHLAKVILFVSHQGKMQPRFSGINEELLKTIALDRMKLPSLPSADNDDKND